MSVPDSRVVPSVVTAKAATMWRASRMVTSMSLLTQQSGLSSPRPAKRWLTLTGLVFGLAGAFVLWRFDPQQTALYPRCPFKLLTGIDCPGCGATRAGHSLLHLDLVSAIRFNAMFVLFVPILGWWGADQLLRQLQIPSLRRLPSIPLPSWTGWLVLAVVVTWWIGRVALHL